MVGWCADVMGYETPEGDVIFDFLGTEEDSLAGETEVD